jgi:uncharacterized protein YbaR (Trm112 family)
MQDVPPADRRPGAARPALNYDPDNGRLSCPRCQRVYPITDDGFPDLRADEAAIAAARSRP